MSFYQKMKLDCNGDNFFRRCVFNGASNSRSGQYLGQSHSVKLMIMPQFHNFLSETLCCALLVAQTPVDVVCVKHIQRRLYSTV